MQMLQKSNDNHLICPDVSWLCVADTEKGLETLTDYRLTVLGPNRYRTPSL